MYDTFAVAAIQNVSIVPPFTDREWSFTDYIAEEMQRKFINPSIFKRWSEAHLLQLRLFLFYQLIKNAIGNVLLMCEFHTTKQFKYLIFVLELVHSDIKAWKLINLLWNIRKN